MSKSDTVEVGVRVRIRALDPRRGDKDEHAVVTDYLGAGYRVQFLDGARVGKFGWFQDTRLELIP